MAVIDAKAPAKGARKSAKRAPRSSAQTAAFTDSPIKRQAVVVVHGQGEQRPMGTIRDFVEVLWQSNPDLGQLEGEEAKTGRKIWIVPDEKSGLFELQRITTPEYPDSRKTGVDGRRTDFFELYYADLLSDTPVRNLWLWAQRLFSIDPEDVTDRMRFPWRVFLILCVIIATLAAIVVLNIPSLLRGDWVAPLLDPGAQVPAGVILACLIALLLPKISSLFTFMRGVPTIVLFVVILVAIFAIYRDPVLLAGMFLALFAYLVMSVLLPLFGDAASYLSAQTVTIRSRQAVRERGLKLLRALHDDSQYERIVVVAHSLGTVLAYDLLHILWRAVGPTKDNKPSDEVFAKLEELDEHVNTVNQRLARDGKKPSKDKWAPADVTTYQDLQWEAFDLLRRQPADNSDPAKPKPAGWKVSDFISLGSPLASAQFLVTEGKADFERMKVERVLPTAPPQPYEAGEQAVHGEGRDREMHHATVFSIVRWTNIYDEFHPFWILFGDLISGPVAKPDVFGNGVRDENVRIIRRGLLPRFFTHNYYWVEPAKAARPAVGHIQALRDAVGLYRGMDLTRMVEGAQAEERPGH